MDNYFDFIMYLAFEVALRYENRRALTIEQLDDYRLRLCDKCAKVHFVEYGDKKFEKRLKKFFEINVTMSEIEKNNNLLMFLNVNNDMFCYKDGIVILKDNVSLEGLEDVKQLFSSLHDECDKAIFGELLWLFDSIECLEALGVTKMKQFVYEIIRDEKRVELAYQNRCFGENVRRLAKAIDFRLSIIGNLSEERITYYNRILDNMQDFEIGMGDFWIISDYMFENDEFYQLVRDDMDDFLSNKFQKAIFDDETLVYDKLESIMSFMWMHRESDEMSRFELLEKEKMECEDNLENDEEIEDYDYEEYFDDEFEDDEEIVFDDYEDNKTQLEIYLEEKQIDTFFYLNYIQKINKYQIRFGMNEELEIVKRRLLYLLDNIDDELYNEEKFNKVLNKCVIEGFDYKHEMERYYIASRLFLIDILEKWVDDEMNLRKILFVSTYYDLTNDIRINRIISKYQNTEMGSKVFNAIYNHEFNQITKSSTSISDKLIKKKILEDEV